MVEETIEPGQFYGTVSAERAPQLDSDVLLTWSENPDDMETFTEDDLVILSEIKNREGIYDSIKTFLGKGL